MLAERARQLPQGWSISRIAEFATECKQRPGYGDDLPVLSVTKHRGIVRSDQFFRKRVHGKDTSNYKVVHPGQFAYATIHLNEGSIGRLRDSTSGIVSPMYTVFDVHDGIDPDYLFAVLKSTRSLDVYAKITQGTVNRRGGISFRTLSGLLLHHPPLPEQRKIAAILSSVDGAIEKTQAVIDQVQVVKRGLMQELLTRGLPGRHTRFKQTEIGRFPEDWRVVAINELGEDARGVVRTGPFGSSMKTRDFCSSGVPVIIIQSLGEGELYSPGLFFTSNEKAGELSEYAVAEGDLVFSRVADIGRCLAVDEHSVGWLISPNLIRIRPDGRKANARFLMYAITLSRAVVRQIASVSGNAGRSVVSAAILRRLRIPLPPLAEQREIARAGREMEDRVRKETDSSTLLKELKDALMSVLLTGELRVEPEP